MIESWRSVRLLSDLELMNHSTYNKYLLLAECEVRMVESFFPFFYGLENKEGKNEDP